jgi:dTDP-4-dehydrorhamnose 3,5-epimerase
VIFDETPLPGAWLVQIEPKRDERGFFARTFAASEFEARGLNPVVAECSVSFNPVRGTLRGLHYQAEPHGECKLIRCNRGAVYDVLVDLRPESPTYCRWFGVELTADAGTLVYAPMGVAHGLLTISDGSEVAYQISSPFVPTASRGVRWDDPVFAIEWPGTARVISERDRTYPDFVP